MTSNWKAPVLAFAGLAALAVAVPIGIANAQQTDQRAGGAALAPPTQRVDQTTRQDVRPDIPMMQRMPMMGGGPAAIVADNAFLYIVQGNQIYKVNKNSLEVVGAGMLPSPQPIGDPFMQPGTPGVRRGGGGEDLPPVRNRGGGDIPPDVSIDR